MESSKYAAQAKEVKMERGLFIVLEGIDNCGKSTQAQMLAGHFRQRGVEVVLTREPGGTEPGENIRKILLDPYKDGLKMLDPATQTLLFYAARSEFLREVVRPNIEAGRTVISDRFEASTFVYQGYVQKTPHQLLKSMHQQVVLYHGCKPDAYIILDITAEESLRRQGNQDRHNQFTVYERQGYSFLEKLREGYRYYAEGGIPLRGGYVLRSDATLIDGMRDVETVHQEILEHIEKLEVAN